MDASHNEPLFPTPPEILSVRRFKKGKDLCAYCGTAVSTDSEDPIPRGLYTSEARAKLQILKIPSCRPCNLAKSKVDSELIAYLTIQRESGQHPESTKVFHDKVIRAVANNNVRLIEGFVSGWDVFDVDETGQLQLVGYAWHGDASAVLEAVRWIARGLHWVAYGQSVKDEWSRSRLMEGDQVTQMTSKISLCHSKRIYVQGEVFTCALVGTPDDAFNETLWAMSFFDSVLFLALTRAAGPPSP